MDIVTSIYEGKKPTVFSLITESLSFTGLALKERVQSFAIISLSVIKKSLLGFSEGLHVTSWALLLLNCKKNIFPIFFGETTQNGPKKVFINVFGKLQHSFFAWNQPE